VPGLSIVDFPHFFKETAMRKTLYRALSKLNAKLFAKKEEGATMVEYGLMVALIAVACIATVTALGVDLSALFGRVDTAVKGVGT
jgi:pilus assembly protein Flp/PilA